MIPSVAVRDETVPHLHPLRPWHGAIVVGAVGVHAVALLFATWWMSVPWAALLATLASLSAAALVRERRPVVAAAVSFALLVGAFALAAIVVRDSSSPLLAPLRSRRVLLYVAGAFGGWLWVLQAPLTLARAWVRLRPAQDAALEVIEPLGYLLVASAAGLALARLSHETAPYVALAGAPGVALLAWAAWRQLARRRWMRRVRDDLDPRWRLTRAGEAAGGDPWTHATEGEALPEVLEAREGAEVYRASSRRVAVARAGGRDERAWRVRRALHAAAGLWGVAVVYWGAVTLLRLHDPWFDVVDVVRSLHVSVDPCKQGNPPYDALTSGRWGARDDEADGGWFNVLSTGRLIVSRSAQGRRESFDRCVDVAQVRDLMRIRGARSGGEDEVAGRLLALPEVRAPASGGETCPRSRWRSFRIESIEAPVSPHSRRIPQVDPEPVVDASGRWSMGCGRGMDHTGQVPAPEARALLDAVAHFVAAEHYVADPFDDWIASFPFSRFVARSCGGGGSELDARAWRVWSLVRQRFCDAARAERPPPPR